MHNARRRLRFTDYTYDLHAFHVSATYTSGRESINFRTIGHGRSTIVSTERYTQSRNADTVESRLSTWSAKLDRVVSTPNCCDLRENPYASEGLSRDAFLCDAVPGPVAVQKSSGLESLSKSAAWTSMSMEPIGYEEGSLRALEQLIGAHNRTRLRTEKQATFIQMMAREALARMRFLSGENFC